MKLIYIKWIDATSNAGWFSKESAEEWCEESYGIVEQVGWLLKETKKYIVLVGRKCDYEKDAGDELGMLQKIPKTWILKRKVLKV